MATHETQSTAESVAAEIRAEDGETEEKMTQKTASQELICPECSRSDFKDPRGLASHRYRAHGVAGSSHSVLAARKHKGLVPPKLGRPLGKISSQAKPKPHKPVAAPAASSQEFAPSMLGYAMGRLQSLAEQIAHENGLPEKQFVQQVALNFAALVQG